MSSTRKGPPLRGVIGQTMPVPRVYHGNSTLAGPITAVVASCCPLARTDALEQGSYPVGQDPDSVKASRPSSYRAYAASEAIPAGPGSSGGRRRYGRGLASTATGGTAFGGAMPTRRPQRTAPPQRAGSIHVGEGRSPGTRQTGPGPLATLGQGRQPAERPDVCVRRVVEEEEVVRGEDLLWPRG